MAACTQAHVPCSLIACSCSVTYYLGHKDFDGVGFYLLHEKTTKHSPLPLVIPGTLSLIQDVLPLQYGT